MEHALIKADIVGVVMEYVTSIDEQYLFIAPVCTSWHRAWAESVGLDNGRGARAQRPAGRRIQPLHQYNHGPCRTRTRAITPETTVPRLMYSFNCGLQRRVQICRAIGRMGNLQLLECARENGYPWDAMVCALAAEGGHLDVIRWAAAAGCKWDMNVCVVAAQSGHVDVVEWAIINGCEWDAEICSAAAGGGHLDVLRWARSNGCPWDSWTCLAAAEGGHLEVLKWVKDCDGPWTVDICERAAMGGHLDVLIWAQEQGVNMVRSQCVEFARQGNHHDVLHYLLTH